MKYTDVDYCNSLISKIDKYKQEIKHFDDLLKRVNEVVAPYTKEIEIKIAEGYISTPVTSVSLENFINFIREEKRNKKELMDKTEEELFSFYPQNK